MKFSLVEDSPMDNGKRWAVVSPRGSTGASLLLARAVNLESNAALAIKLEDGFSFLETDDFQGDYDHMKAHGVRFTERSPGRGIWHGGRLSGTCMATSGISFKESNSSFRI